MPPPSSANSIDLTSQPSLTGGEDRGLTTSQDSQAIDRYAREIERLAQQSRGISDLTQSLIQVVREVSTLTKDFRGLSEAATRMGTALKESFAKSLESIASTAQSQTSRLTGGASSQPSQTQQNLPVLTGVAAATVVTAVARSLQATPSQIKEVAQVVNRTQRQESPDLPLETIEGRQAGTPIDFTLGARTKSAQRQRDYRARKRQEAESKNVNTLVEDVSKKLGILDISDKEKELAQSLPLEEINPTPTSTSTATATAPPEAIPVKHPEAVHLTAPVATPIATPIVPTPTATDNVLPSATPLTEPTKPIPPPQRNLPEAPEPLETNAEGKLRNVTGRFVSPTGDIGKALLKSQAELEKAYQESLESVMDQIYREREDYENALKEYQTKLDEYKKEVERLTREQEAEIPPEAMQEVKPPEATPFTAPTAVPLTAPVATFAPTTASASPPSVPPPNPPTAPPSPGDEGDGKGKGQKADRTKAGRLKFRDIKASITAAFEEQRRRITPSLNPEFQDEEDIREGFRRRVEESMKPGASVTKGPMGYYRQVLHNQQLAERRSLVEKRAFSSAEEANLLLEPQPYIEAERERLRLRSQIASTSTNRGRLTDSLHGTPEHSQAVSSEVVQTTEATTRSLREQVYLLSKRNEYLSSPEGNAQLREQLILQEGVNRQIQVEASAQRRTVLSDIRKSPQYENVLYQETSEKAQGNIEELREQVRLAQQKAKFLSSREGRDALREEAKLSSQLTRENRANRYRELAGQTNAFSASTKMLNDYLKENGVTLESISRLGTHTFVGGTASILAMVSAANPVAFNTFKASITGVAGAIGEMFGPAVLQVSEYLQRFEGFIDSLDPATKTLIVRVTGLTLGAAGLAMVFGRLIPMVVNLGRALTFFSVTNPWVAGLVGITAIVGALGAAWLYTSSSADKAKNAMERAGNVRIDEQGRIVNQRENKTDITATLEKTGRFQRELENAGNAAEMRRVIQRSRVQAQKDITDAEERVARAGGNVALNREREITEANVLLPRVKREFDRLLLAEVNRLRKQPFGIGAASALELSGTPEKQIPFARAAAQKVITETGGITSVTNQANIVDRLISGLTGGSIRINTESPAIIAAQQSLNSAKSVLDALNRLAGLSGQGRAGATGPMLSTKGLFPAPQMFTDFTKVGEQLTLKTLERPGEKDIINELRQIRNSLEAIGQKADVLTTQTHWTELMKFFTPGR